MLVLEFWVRARARVKLTARVRDSWGYETPKYEKVGGTKCMETNKTAMIIFFLKRWTIISCSYSIISDVVC